MKINGYEIDICSDGVQVGCKKFSVDDINKLLEEIKKVKNSPQRKILEAIKSGYNTRDPNSLQVLNETIAQIRQYNANFLGIRYGGEYAGRGFYLGYISMPWKIVIDGRYQVLIPADEENQKE